MNYWSLLDIKQAVLNCDRNLANIVSCVTTLLEDTNGASPPQGELLLANTFALRERLACLIPPACEEAIREEQAKYDAEESKWTAYYEDPQEGHGDTTP